ncbi:MAG: hypothetical protein KTR29_22015 [Rhodothermaceae bacterium]|nr:hypothetical protein [Rhodothermaceae bacterium]
MIQPIKVILEKDGRLRPLVAIDPPGDGSRELAIIVLPSGSAINDLSEEDYRYIEGVSQDALAELWENEEENVWGDL